MPDPRIFIPAVSVFQSVITPAMAHHERTLDGGLFSASTPVTATVVLTGMVLFSLAAYGIIRRYRSPGTR